MDKSGLYSIEISEGDEMINLSVLNYSKLNDEEIEGYISSFIKYLKEHGIKNGFQINHCGELLKKRFQEYINIDNVALIDNQKLILELNCYLGELSNYINTQNYKFIFIGEQLNIQNEWGEANNWIAVIKELKEKVIWHEIAHLLGANDHYHTETHATLDICSNPSHCIMTFGMQNGELCSESLQEIRNEMSVYNQA